MKKIYFLLTCSILLNTLTLCAQTVVKKGPPSLAGVWVMKENGVTTRHYTATQTGNSVTLQCSEYPAKVLQFSWDEPGNYVLSGTSAGVQFDQTSLSRTVRQYFGKEVGQANYKVLVEGTGGYYSPESVNAIYVKQYDADEYTVPVINYNDVLTCSLCQNNSFTVQGRFTVSAKGDEITVYTKSVWIRIPRPSIIYDHTEGDGIYARKLYKAVSGGSCCNVTYDANYTYAMTLTRVKDSW